MSDLKTDINDGYFFTRKNLDTIKSKSKVGRKTKETLESPLKKVCITSKEKPPEKAKIKKVEIPTRKTEPLLKEVIKKVKKIQFLAGTW